MGLIIISNREPYAPKRGEDGELRWVPSIGGLTAALDPALQHAGGTWIAWGEELPEISEVDLPQDAPRYRLKRLRLSEAEVRDFYYGFSNRALWPMSHYFIGRTKYQTATWRAYVNVNRRFAKAAVESYREGDLIWVHDYQLALVPRMIREALPHARIGFFWHIPWPSAEVFRTLPWDRELLDGLLGADLIGMHTQDYVRYFQIACERVLGAETEGDTVRWQDHISRMVARPIGIEVETFEELATSPEVEEEADRIRRTLQTQILLGVDRLDYTKGIPERLEAFDAFLDRHPEARGRVTLLQIAVPSRERVESYRQLRAQVEGLVGRINGKHTRDGWSPVQYIYRGVSREELVAHYRAADVMLVTPLRDGLNLVAKEFAASSRDGVLILSRFAGAADEMPEALQVNPYNVDGLAGTLLEALQMPLDEKKARLQRLRERLKQSDLHAWAEGFIQELAAT
ncbi:trehalose-6-phosphate synthase [Deinococcus metallilatus]|uniref:Trehalose-6-phosphate synthase n=1 Tax=Deinococcus metallilatus TaxID=1211322 RepID=A0AAJ5JZ68_9DEIO|nr:trehalose-6-phosphate synthase [Deinococcus metallilatus]MBB5294548.1 trehalose 6-phosphate synthase [Deinococcus metallilatus]QBY07593.1 trehalose-6-phosphate synthase [Deinococcus metallilatus]RXJ14009.1 trehalose-6-phosphate synthase [Deinococcus metallilatus]TLK29974.1 trehalose-6-phosphate synthase [Deinococcus metallilatus]GMA15761.1 trehalose-6-phosphate synthase [Deinococcus metallilatus]